MTAPPRRHHVCGSSVAGILPSLIAMTSLTACAAGGPDQAQTPTSAESISSAPTTSGIPAPQSTPSPRTVKWIDLQIGDCLAEAPPTDPNVVTVTVVGCSDPHLAEVYSRVPVAVDAAIADVANRECVANIPQYTGQTLAGAAFSMTYLIDSDQDRTSGNPAPSTVICLLQPASGQPTTGSARRRHVAALLPLWDG